MKGEEDHWVDLTLEEILQRKPELEVHLVSLTQFRQAIGDTWDRVGAKAIMLAEATLRKVAGHGNPVRVFSEEGVFLLAFPRLSELEGRRRATEAAIAVGQKLVGARFRIVGDGMSAPLVCLASNKGNSLLDAQGDFKEQTILAMETEATPLAESAAVNDADSSARTGQDSTDFFISITSSDSDDPEWSPIDRETGRHDNEISTIDKNNKLSQYNPKWRAMKHKGRKESIQLVPINHKTNKKDYFNEWVPIKKDNI
ncbi:hypothetical protein HEQ60_05950 [Haematospirillum sp. H1815]|uniref:hypothetical protein n=1 Tax=Haematospirillum sp. H1815 TaxID=2723108 RepID=UPI001439317A|nr:hypothetical protein [Haematospirillum sp. H1815]NKD77302.1 hypothetical protein [Haematospirillum sp. H1815]